MRTLALFLLALLTLAPPLGAEPREYLGYGHMLTNDVIGDTRDRWRSGSYASSRVWGPEWTGTLPDRAGLLLEVRINGEVIAPENLSTPAPGDRPYAGALSLGLHTHFNTGVADLSLGGDLVVTGPQTGLDDFQEFLHDYLGGLQISQPVRQGQIANDVHPTLVAEAGHGLDLGGRARLRPFAETRWGVETLVRAGADLVIGTLGQGDLMVREPVTGHRYSAVRGPSPGLSYLLGADLAYVGDSEFLPAGLGMDVTEWRGRVRAGLHWEGRKGARLFYGLTWLSEEFEAQREGQVLGSVRIGYNF